MTSLHNQSVLPLTKYLTNLSGILKAGVKFADANGKSHDELLNFRLIADMRPSVVSPRAFTSNARC